MALALLLVLTAAAEAQRSTIRGKVRTPNGNPVNNAIVELRLGGGGMIGQTVTRNDGDFAFSGLEPAEYEVFVLMAGFQSAADPKYVVGPQRNAIERGERRGASRREPNVRDARPVSRGGHEGFVGPAVTRRGAGRPLRHVRRVTGRLDQIERRPVSRHLKLVRRRGRKPENGARQARADRLPDHRRRTRPLRHIPRRTPLDRRLGETHDVPRRLAQSVVHLGERERCGVLGDRIHREIGDGSWEARKATAWDGQRGGGRDRGISLTGGDDEKDRREP